jgi:carbohydrate-selective porin OprB
MCRVHRRPSVCLARLRLLSGLVLLVMFAVPLIAQTNAAAPDVANTLFEIPSQQYLFGDWGGKRSKLAEKGVNFDFFYIADLEAKSERRNPPEELI